MLKSVYFNLHHPYVTSGNNWSIFAYPLHSFYETISVGMNWGFKATEGDGAR